MIYVVMIAVVALAYIVWRKNRGTWSEIFRLRRELVSMQAEIVAARKEAAIASIREETRLPLKMPSQNGEDVVLWNFFDRKRSGFFVDVGAYDGVGFSNSYFFEAIGWTGVLVEAVPDLYQAAVAARPHSRVVHAAAGNRSGSVKLTVVEGEQGVATLSSTTPDRERIAREGGHTREVDVPIVTLNEILAHVREPIDFVSIDVEGAELDVLTGFDLARFKPRVLIIEDNSNGADRRVSDYLAQRGYREQFRVEQNVFYTA